MDLTYKIIIAVVAGLFVFYIMKTMTKWAFRIIIALLFIAGVFYMYLHVDDIKAIFNEEMKEPAVNQTIWNITAENITAAQELPQEPEALGGLPE